MRNVQINNTEVLEALNNYKDFLMSNDIDSHLHLMCKDKKAEDYVSSEYRKMIMTKGESHTGFPEVMKSYDGLMPTKYKDKPAPMKTPKGYQFTDQSSILNSRMMESLSARVNTLNTCYPPEGFISWHNNANAPGYNVLFSWSETGDGWFKYWDWDKQEEVTIHDVPGWQCKMGYFGRYMDPKSVCYHAAYTKCWRISVAYVFNDQDDFWKEVVEDIENPI